MYDKKMWDDDGALIQPPTFRAIADIVLDIVGNATGHKWIGYIDDALFATLDLNGHNSNYHPFTASDSGFVGGSLGCSLWHPYTFSQLTSTWTVKPKPIYGYYTINRRYFGDGTGGRNDYSY